MESSYPRQRSSGTTSSSSTRRPSATASAAQQRGGNSGGDKDLHRIHRRRHQQQPQQQQQQQPQLGTHNRPWQAEDEYVHLQQSHSSLSPRGTSSGGGASSRSSASSRGKRSGGGGEGSSGGGGRFSQSLSQLDYYYGRDNNSGGVTTNDVGAVDDSYARFVRRQQRQQQRGGGEGGGGGDDNNNRESRTSRRQRSSAGQHHHHDGQQQIPQRNHRSYHERSSTSATSLTKDGKRSSTAVADSASSRGAGRPSSSSSSGERDREREREQRDRRHASHRSERRERTSGAAGGERVSVSSSAARRDNGDDKAAAAAAVGGRPPTVSSSTRRSRTTAEGGSSSATTTTTTIISPTAPSPSRRSRSTGATSNGGTLPSAAPISPTVPSAATTSRELRARRLREQDAKKRDGGTDPGGTEDGQRTHRGSGHSPGSGGATKITGDGGNSKLLESAAKRERLFDRAAGMAISGGGSGASSSAATTKVRAATGRDNPQKNASAQSSDMNPVGTQHQPAPQQRGWSTLGRRSAETSATPSSNSKVNSYLAQRNTTASGGSATGGTAAANSRRTDTATTVSAAASASISDSSNAMSFDISEDDSSSEEELDDSDGTSSDEDVSGDGDAEEWCVRVCVVSAVDFPANVVPNLPLSPILRVGLVKVPNDEHDMGRDAFIKQQKRRKQLVTTMSQHGGLRSLPRSRVKCTAPKILSKRDNGSVEFHEELRWDNVRRPQEAALVLELSSRAVMAPRNYKESPPAQKIEPPRVTTATSLVSAGGGRSVTPSSRQVSDGSTSETNSTIAGIGSLFRRPTGKKVGKSEKEKADAAAAVAKLLVDGNVPKPAPVSGESLSAPKANKPGNQSEVDVKLRPRKRRKYAKMTEDLYIGAQIIPLTNLPLQKALQGKESARIEQWFELESAPDGPSPSSTSAAAQAAGKRNPSVLLEITFTSVDALDDSEDEMDDTGVADADLKASFSRRASQKIRSQLQEEVVEKEETKVEEEPELGPGVLDYVCVVGARDIGDQKLDDGSSGWVNATPECCVLERFPSTDEYHQSNGRNVSLPNKVEWFCFPEGCRLWRGTTPPNLDELNLKRFSASSPANIATSIASFDACLGCTTSFSWFAISSNSDEYGSENVKTYGAVIRFFVPAPSGIDRTQDDFAQALIGTQAEESMDMLPEGKRLWVPIGICLTSSIPIVGTMEAILLRICETLSCRGFSSGNCLTEKGRSTLIHQELASMVLCYQRPIPGVVNCSVPFMKGERFHLSLPPRGGLSALPHGNAVASVCRLLGADGLNYMLAAVLTECKILVHSDDVANLCLVAEVMTALIYPFSWSLPYVPVLPAEMMEFIEAPLSYFLGVPTCNIKLVDPIIFEDVVVVDLDKDFSTADYVEPEERDYRTKNPTPLPASVAGNISKAVYRLLRAEEDAEEDAFMAPGSRPIPRMEPESQAEREFRVAVAMEISGLIRGYQDCLVYASSSQPVFNMDRFLQIAPALFEEQRGTSTTSGKGQEEHVSQFVLSPRSRRFMSLLVNCQHFHQLLETLESDRSAFFHETMSTISTNNVTRRTTKRNILSLDFHKNMESLCTFLQRMEDKVPTYRVHRVFGDEKDESDDEAPENGEVPVGARFPRDLLQQIVIDGESKDASGEGVRSISIEYLMELEKNPWRYHNLFAIPIVDGEGKPIVSHKAKVKLKDAIGERRYQAWKLALEQEKFDYDEMSVLSEESKSRKPEDKVMDINSLLTSATADLSSTSSEGSSSNLDDAGMTSAQKRVADAKDRDILRRCLEKALTSARTTGDSSSGGKARDLLTEAEVALRNPSARRFLLSVLSKRTAQQNLSESSDRRRGSTSGSSKLDCTAFETLLRLACAMLDTCMEADDFDSAYAMLKLTAGIYTITGEHDSDVAVVYMTGRLGLVGLENLLTIYDLVAFLSLAFLT